MTGPDLSVLREDYKQSQGLDSDTTAASAAPIALEPKEPVTFVRPAHVDVPSGDGKEADGEEDEDEDDEDGDIKGIYFETENGDHQAFNESDDE